MNNIDENDEIQLLKFILSISKNKLKEYLISKLKKEGYKIHIKKKYIYCLNKNSNLNVMLTAHYDTVNEIKKDRILLHDQEKDIIWGQGGLGADDRAGIYAIINIVEKLKVKHILFCDEEETGGIGCRDFVNDKKINTNQLNWILALDRRGHDNYVSYSNDNKEFKKFIEEFKFKEEQGSCSDLSHLMPSLNVSGANLCVGYYCEHTEGEMLSISVLNDTITRSIEILGDKRVETKFEYVAKPIDINYNYLKSWGFNDYGYEDSNKLDESIEYSYWCPLYNDTVFDMEEFGKCAVCEYKHSCTDRDDFIKATTESEQDNGNTFFTNNKKSIESKSITQQSFVAPQIENVSKEYKFQNLNTDDWVIVRKDNTCFQGVIKHIEYVKARKSLIEVSCGNKSLWVSNTDNISIVKLNM